MDESTVVMLAERLATATRHRRAVPQLTSEYPEMSAADAYRVQQHQVQVRMDEGETIVGWKVGLTSRAMQVQLGVDTPDYAPILSRMKLRDGAAVTRSDLIAPRAEGEICFVLGARLEGPGVTVEDVLHATRGVCPAIEVIDSRIIDWKLTLSDTVADLASSARVVVSSQVTPIHELDLRLVGLVMEQNGQVVATGAGAAVLGDPAAAVAWAANTLAPLGVVFEPGHIVMPGALHASVGASAGDTFTATFDHLGSVSVRFS